MWLDDPALTGNQSILTLWVLHILLWLPGYISIGVHRSWLHFDHDGIIWNKDNKLHHGWNKAYLCKIPIISDIIKIIIKIVIVFTNKCPAWRPRGGTHVVVAWSLKNWLKSIFGASKARNDTNNNRKESLYTNKHTEHKEYILQTLFMHKNGKNMTHFDLPK